MAAKVEVKCQYCVAECSGKKFLVVILIHSQACNLKVANHIQISCETSRGQEQAPNQAEIQTKQGTSFADIIIRSEALPPSIMEMQLL